MVAFFVSHGLFLFFLLWMVIYGSNVCGGEDGNLSFGKWVQVFGDAKMTTALSIAKIVLSKPINWKQLDAD